MDKKARYRIRFLRWVATMVILIANYGLSFSQSVKVIQGVIRDAETNESIVGVSVKIKNSNVGAITNADGKYSIRAKDGDVLLFSFVGYEPKALMVGKDSNIDVRLSQDQAQLKEIVVIGYGSVAKEDLTGSVGQVKMSDLNKAPVATFEQALAGRVAGVQVTSNDDQPGSGMNIIIRGAGSLSQSTAPLYVVDGFPIEDFDAGALNPNDIESISVLKDASATAIYGARGANGVVVIETKKGKEGMPVIAYNGSLGTNTVTNRMEIMDAYEFVRYQVDMSPATASLTYFPDIQVPGSPTVIAGYEDLQRYRNAKMIDWQDRLFRTGSTGIYNLSLRGGTAQTKYMISGSLFDQEGTVSNSGYKRYQGRVSLDQVITKKLKAGINLNYNKIYAHGQVAAEGEGTNALLYAAWGYRPISGRLTNEDFDLENELLDPDVDPGRDSRVNPVLSAENVLRQRNNTGFLANAYANYNFTRNLYLKVQGSVNNAMVENEYFYNSQTAQGTPLRPSNVRGIQGGTAYVQNNTYSNENTLNFNQTFNKIHVLNLVGGFSAQLSNLKSYGIDVQNLPNEGLGLSGLKQGIASSIRSEAYDVTLASFFGRAMYNLNAKYLFTATFRADGSSKFARQNRWGYFPSGAFAWRMSNENFMKKLTFVDEAKLRLSYGVTGNNRVGAFDYLPQLEVMLNRGYSYNNGATLAGAIPTNLGNQNLKWESTAQFDIGYDLSLFKGRIDLTADVYRKTVSDLLLRANMPWVSGYGTAFKNIGKLQNQGLEITLNTVNLSSGAFKWQSNFNISFNDNKVLALSNNEEFLMSNISWQPAFNTAFPYVARLGEPSSQFFGVLWDGLYQQEDFDISSSGVYNLKSYIPDNGSIRANIRPGDIKYKDINGDGTVDSRDATIIGRTLPVHTGGFSNNFSYKGFDLNVFFQWSYGNDILNANKSYFMGNQAQRPNLNQYAAYADRWTPENPNNTLFRAMGGGPNGVYSSWMIEDGSFLRLKTVSLRYAFPEKMINSIKLKTLSVTASAQNLLTWTSYSGMDPEVSVRNSVLTPGLDFSAYPRSRTIVFGINTTF